MRHDLAFRSALALLAGILFLSPVLYSIWMSFQTANSYYQGGFVATLDNYWRVISEYNFAR